MEENRKKIIVNEIKFWKESRMLPSQYCDYLLAFYSEGNVESPSKKQTQRRFLSPAYGMVALLVIGALVVNYFTEIPNLLQMSLYSFFLAAMIGLVFFFKKKDDQISLPIAAAGFILLLGTVRTWEIYAAGNDIILYISLLINCFIWYIVGKKYHQPYFTIAAIFGVLSILYFAGQYVGVF